MQCFNLHIFFTQYFYWSPECEYFYHLCHSVGGIPPTPSVWCEHRRHNLRPAARRCTDQRWLRVISDDGAMKRRHALPLNSSIKVGQHLNKFKEKELRHLRLHRQSQRKSQLHPNPAPNIGIHNNWQKLTHIFKFNMRQEDLKDILVTTSGNNNTRPR